MPKVLVNGKWVPSLLTDAERGGPITYRLPENSWNLTDPQYSGGVNMPIEPWARNEKDSPTGDSSGVPWFFGSDDPFARGAQVEYDPSKWTPQELMAYFEAIKQLASGNPWDPNKSEGSGETPTEGSGLPPSSTSTDTTSPADPNYPDYGNETGGIEGPPVPPGSTKDKSFLDKVGDWVTQGGDYVGKYMGPIKQIGGAIGDIVDLFKTPPEGVDKQQATAQQEMIKGTILNFEKQALSGAISPQVALQGIRNALAMWRNSSEYDAAGMTVVMQIASNAISNIQNKQNYAMGAPSGESNDPSYRNWTTGELGERTKNLSTQMLLGNNIGKDFAKDSPLGTFVKPVGEKMTDFLNQSKNFVGSMMPTDTKYEPAADQIRQQFQDQRKKLLFQQNYGV